MRHAPDLHDLLQDLSEELGRRLVVLDDQLTVRAYSIHESEIDRQRLSFVLAHHDTWSDETLRREPQVDQVAGLGRRLLWPLHDQRHRVGSLLIVLEDDEADVPADLAAQLGAATPGLAVTLSLQDLYREQDRHRTRVLVTELLTGPEGDRPQAASALVEQRLIGAAEQYSVVALGARGLRETAVGENQVAGGSVAGTLVVEQAMQAVLEFVSRTTTASIAGARIADQAALIFPRPVVGARLERILDAPAFAGVSAGIGPLVGSLEQAAHSFDRARRAWRVGGSTVTGWDELGADRPLSALPLDFLGLDDLPPRVVGLLGLGPVSVHTVQSYLDSGGDARATAAALSIHRSTLYYRLDRVRDRLGVDLSDGRVRTELALGLRVAQLADLSDTVSESLA